MSAERRGTLQFIGVANLIVCGLFLIMSIPFFLGQIHVLRSWPTADARVTKSTVVNQPAPKHSQLYAAQLQMTYVVDGTTITSDLTSYQSSNYEKTARRAAEYPVGSAHQIRYDPEHPNQARIGAGWNRRFFAVPLITLGCGLCFAVLAVVFFVAGRLARPTPKTS